MSNPNTTKRPTFLDAPALEDIRTLTGFYGPVAPSVIVRRALSFLAQHVGDLDSDGPEAAQERAAVLAFVRPRRSGREDATRVDA